jgi:endonuclease YncB( thermonuclease family)
MEDRDGVTVWGPYRAIVSDWHDGDTCHLDALDLGFGIVLAARDIDGHPIWSARIFGVNAPELSTDAGKAALVYAQQLCPSGTRVTVLSHSLDKFGGRFDATLTLPDGRDYAAAMIEAGQAVVYKP